MLIQMWARRGRGLLPDDCGKLELKAENDHEAKLLGELSEYAGRGKMVAFLEWSTRELRKALEEEKLKKQEGKS